ncbi:MAG TPA: spore germination protein [Bacillales bacterium]
MALGKWLRNRRKKSNETKFNVPNQILEEHKDDKVSGNLDKTLSFIQQLLGESFDFEIRRFHIFGQTPAALVYFSNMTDQGSINHDILRPLMSAPVHITDKKVKTAHLKETILNDSLYHTECRLERNLAHIVQAILRGDTLIAVKGLNEGFLVGTNSVAHRAVTQPETEQVVRGPHDGFIERLGTNISLLRYRLQTVNFRVKTTGIGRVTKSRVAVCFLKGVANEDLVQEVERRLSKIDIDGPLDSGYLEQFIEDNHFSPFPQMQTTERPDKAAATLMEGRVVIFLDGSPIGLIAPAVFSQFYQTVDDYSERFLMGTLVRFIRLVALVFSLVFPSLYVAIISFNPELIPTAFAVAVAGGRSGVPFPAVIEVLLLEITMEVLREATIRMPQQIGGAISIVGVLVIGQAAVQAGFASPITIVIVALTTIGSFATPAYNAAISLRMLKFPIFILAGIFGLYGVMISLLFIANHMLSLKSFGVPYMSPIVPGNAQSMKDAVIRGPLWWMRMRPDFLDTPNRHRVNKNLGKAENQGFNAIETNQTDNSGR